MGIGSLLVFVSFNGVKYNTPSPVRQMMGVARICGPRVRVAFRFV